MSIKRYDMNGPDGEWEYYEYPDGKWVLYDDHVAEVGRLTRRVPNPDDLRAAVEYAEAWIGDGHPYVTGDDRRIARVRATLEEE